MNKTLTIVGTFVLGAAVGTVAGYFASRKRAQLYYAEMAANDIQAVKEHYRLLRKEDFESPKVEEEPKNDPSKIKVVDKEDLDDLQMILMENGYTASAEEVAGMFKRPVSELSEFFAKMGSVEDDAEPIDLPVTSVFSVDEGDYIDQEDLMSADPEYKKYVENRTFENPYPIHINEFMDDSPEREQVSLTYFEGDDTLTDEQDQVVPNPEALLGYEFRGQFGKFSGHADVLYIRNEPKSVDFEIHHNEAGYFDVTTGVESGDD